MRIKYCSWRERPGSSNWGEWIMT